jgi:predicted Zn finger-like uncharacterized protein
MTIHINCPNCGTPYKLADSHAGKRANCKKCKTVFTIPAPVSAPADLEEFAANALVDEPPPPEPPKETRTIDFICPMCDTPVKVSIDLEGKQTPCPECKRIVKVPKIVRDDPKDWRAVKKDGPSAALKNEPAAPEGAWGSTAAAQVSRQALVEADVLPQVREKLTTAQKVKRGLLAAAALGVVALGVWLTFSFLSSSRQKKALDLALASVADEGKFKLGPVGAAEVHRAAGEYLLRLRTRKDTEDARTEFQTARTLLGQPAGDREREHEREFLLVDLAASQVELGGEGLDVERGIRLSWPKTLEELQQTLSALPVRDDELPPGLLAGGPRVAALREVGRRLLAKGQGLQASALALAVLPGKDELRPEGLAQVGLLLLATDKAAAENLADQALEAYGPAEGENADANPEAKRPPVAPSLVALCYALEKPDPYAAFKGEPAEASRPGYAAAQVYKGNAEQGRAVAKKAGTPLLRLQALIALAAAESGQQAEAAKPDLEAAADVVERDFKGRGVPPGLLLELFQLGLRAGLTERLRGLAEGLADPAVRGQMQLELLRARLAASKKADASADAVDKQAPVAHALAQEAVARAKARRDSGTFKEVGGWDEALQPFGYAGVALGLQDGG